MSTTEELYLIFNQSKWHSVHWKYRLISTRFRIAQCQGKFIQQGPVVQKPVNFNPGLALTLG